MQMHVSLSIARNETNKKMFSFRNALISTAYFCLNQNEAYFLYILKDNAYFIIKLLLLRAHYLYNFIKCHPYIHYVFQKFIALKKIFKKKFFF